VAVVVVGLPGTYCFVRFKLLGGVSLFLSVPTFNSVAVVGRLCLCCNCSVVLLVGLIYVAMYCEVLSIVVGFGVFG
jgi:hypothetical protein